MGPEVAVRKLWVVFVVCSFWVHKTTILTAHVSAARWIITCVHLHLHLHPALLRFTGRGRAEADPSCQLHLTFPAHTKDANVSFVTETWCCAASGCCRSRTSVSELISAPSSPIWIYPRTRCHIAILPSLYVWLIHEWLHHLLFEIFVMLSPADVLNWKPAISGVEGNLLVFWYQS